MSSRLDAIKARHEIANSQPITDLRVWDSVFDVPRLVAALESVLELHQPYITRSAWQTCNECWNSGTAEIVYPCPTVAAIRTALGEGEQ